MMRGPISPILILILLLPLAQASEIVGESKTLVIIREHPKTQKPDISIVSSETPPPDPFEKQRTWASRPDYRMLDPKVKSGTILYEGPYSDRKKVYILAASLMAVGTVGGIAAYAAAPAATGAGAAGGAGAYAAAGGAVAGEAAVIALQSNPQPQKESYIHKSGSHEEIQGCQAGNDEACHQESPAGN